MPISIVGARPAGEIAELRRIVKDNTESYSFPASNFADAMAHLHPIVAAGAELYARLAPIANGWAEQLGSEQRYPTTHTQMLERCHSDGQTRPTPLMLKYREGDFNCLHQDLYGEHLFPLQVVILLSDQDDFDGGEFVLTEQRPRMQSRVEVVGLKKGHGVVFAVNERPKLGTRGYYRRMVGALQEKPLSGVTAIAGIGAHRSHGRRLSHRSRW